MRTAEEIWATASTDREGYISSDLREAALLAIQIAQSEIIYWLRTDEAKGNDEGADYADEFADIISSRVFPS